MNLLPHSGENERHGPAGMGRGHGGPIHQLGPTQRELGHRRDGATRGTQRQTTVAINCRAPRAPCELGP
jgi:hypothetical protein